ncbi:MAG: type II toxin-antitoxin system HicB family antitoxin [Hyphomicrobiales bacterium]|nr:type II toxin-antitoxin system HicB family antitoxin [Hyphomicrobiales bacterium]MBV8825947.1 type II toxin-antitoxin system HicB family antitoxin [Hyphomicrobiales bacterium]MBV9426932.1 type II toxin-antitoxin system HicB family antitoxin [Bradyrhizobiaceae bacterium]
MVAVVALVHGKPGAYGISFPDFPGCVSGGATVDESLRRGRDALDFHVESMIEVGEPLPKIRDIAEIKADPEYADDFADAMVTVVDAEVPAKAVRVNISIDERLLDRIDRAAEASGETRSGFFAAAARERLHPGGSAGQMQRFDEPPSPAYRHERAKSARVKKKRQSRAR